jgi:ribosome-associated protein
MIEFTLKKEQPYIELFKLIKLLDLVDRGSDAKLLISQGVVKRNGEIETKKRAKIVSGDIIEIAEAVIHVKEFKAKANR